MDNRGYVKKLKELVSIESVSTDKSRFGEMIRAAAFIKNELADLGFEVDLNQESDCPPLVLGKMILDKNYPTIGIYAHYDVQPEDPVERWGSPPFALTEKSGKLFGRGVADDKMHIIQAIAAVRNLLKKNGLRNNVLFIFEGEEEKGSDHFEKLVEKSKSAIGSVDAFYVLDVGMKTKRIPQIFYGLRGIAGYELKVRTGKTDLHSGVYGNRVLNAASVACDLMSKMKNPKTGIVTIPGFYDSVKKFSDEEIALLSEYVPDLEVEKKNAGVNGFTAGFLDSKVKPALDINGMISGFTGDGFKTIIPAEAIVKFSVRMIEDQKGPEINKIIDEFISRNMPPYAEYELLLKGDADPFFTDYNNRYAKKTATILEEVFGEKCLFNRSGGSIPAAEVLQRIFGKPIILTGFTLPDENIHAPDENVDVEMFEKGITAIEKLLSVA